MAQRRHNLILMVPKDSPASKTYSLLIAPREVGQFHMFVLRCSEVDSSDVHYLAVVLDEPTKARGLRLRIPHHFVVMIHDYAFKKELMGFAKRFHEDLDQRS